MTKPTRHTALFLLLLLSSVLCFAQKDTARRLTPDSLVKVSPLLKNQAQADSIRKAFNPKKATIRSLILPGWGQAYNKKYWKIPIVYGALGISGSVFFYNLSNYRDIRFAYAAKYKASLTPPDSTDYRKIKSYLLRFDLNSLRNYRDEFRQNIDYSVLVFFLLWGVNVADATVDAHLKTFDVAPDLSLRFKFGPSQLAGTMGFSLVLGVKNKKDALRPLPSGLY